MATTNRDRRKAKQKARDQRRQPGSSGAYEQVLGMIALASRPGPHDDPDLLAALAAGLGLAGGVRLVDRALPYGLQDALGYLFTDGWQPADLVRYARREYGELAAEVMVDIIAGRMREYPASTVDPRWSGQLTEVGAAVWWGSDAEWLPGFVARHGADRASAVEAAVRVLRLIRGAPRLPTLMPPPGQARPGADPRVRGGRPVARVPAPAPDRRALDKIRALLAKAESTTFPEEAETYTAKAQELMARYSIDAALLDASAPNRAEPVAVRIGVEAPYEGPKSILLTVVAQANRCRAVWSKDFGFNTVFGFETDLELVELLFTSLLVQATTAMTAHGSQRDRYGRSSTRSFRQSFLTSYANRIGERLAGVTERASAEAAAEVGSALLPVLAARDETVQEQVDAVFPTLVQQRMSVTNAAGWEHGREAADRASLQPRRVLT